MTNTSRSTEIGCLLESFDCQDVNHPCDLIRKEPGCNDGTGHIIDAKFVAGTVELAGEDINMKGKSLDIRRKGRFERNTVRLPSERQRHVHPGRWLDGNESSNSLEI